MNGYIKPAINENEIEGGKGNDDFTKWVESPYYIDYTFLSKLENCSLDFDRLAKQVGCSVDELHFHTLIKKMIGE